jgi:hypothetical protein
MANRNFINIASICAQTLNFSAWNLGAKNFLLNGILKFIVIFALISMGKTLAVRSLRKRPIFQSNFSTIFSLELICFKENPGTVRAFKINQPKR